MALIDQIKEDLLDALNVSEYKDTNAPNAEEKREAKYTVGESLLKARKEFESDNEFGEWVRSGILEKCPTELDTKTLFRYRQLAEFGSYSECEKVGFTNVYKLMQESNRHLIEHAKNAENKRQVSELINPPEKVQAVNDCINDFINNLEEIASDWCDSPADLLIDALLGSNDKKAYKAALSKYHPDKGGDPRLFNVVKALRSAKSI